MRHLLFFVFIILVISSCTKEIAPDPVALGYKYYPVQIGDYWIYQVTETRFQNQFASQANDSITYLVRERVDTIFNDLTGENTFKIVRSRRNLATEEWGNDSVFVLNVSNSSVRLTKNNVKVIPFIFPVVEGKKWNAHIFNTQSSVTNKAEETFYSFANTGQPFQMAGTTYPNTVKVVQLFNDNVIERQDLYEVYGYGIGRLYKQELSYQYCSDPERQSGCEVGNQFIVTGIKRVEKLQEHGSVK